MFEISVERSFSASHALRLGDGVMEDPHEHEWRVVATLRSELLDETMGVVADFVEVDRALARVVEPWVGGDLNAQEAFSDGRPSAERVAEDIARRLGRELACDALLYRVSVTEAPGCVAAFYPDADQG